MPDLTRFGVSIETELLERFDSMTGARGYRNRSEAIRDLMRERLVEEGARDRRVRAFAVLSIVYDHHARDLERRLTDLQHDHYHAVLSATHVHIDHDNCLEVVLLRGKVGEIRDLAEAVATMKGVKHSKLIFTSEEAVI